MVKGSMLIKRMKYFFVGVFLLLAVCFSCARKEDSEQDDSVAVSNKEARVEALQSTTSLFYRDLFGDRLLHCADRRAGGTLALDGGPVGLYFAAQWNPACRYFTPKLVAFYRALKEEGVPFEIVFISQDRTEEDMLAHVQELEMPWWAVPFEQNGRRQRLAQKYAVADIPQLVVVDAAGNLLTADGVSDVSQWGIKALPLWQ
jgi:thiol-disulfide isomerase/thioredoxin